jgi:hypothetical protein
MLESLQFQSLGEEETDEQSFVNENFHSFLLPPPPREESRFPPLAALERKDPQLNGLEQLVLTTVRSYTRGGIGTAPSNRKIIQKVRKTTTQQKGTRKADVNRTLYRLKDKKLIYYRELPNATEKVWFSVD